MNMDAQELPETIEHCEFFEGVRDNEAFMIMGNQLIKLNNHMAVFKTQSKDVFYHYYPLDKQLEREEN